MFIHTDAWASFWGSKFWIPTFLGGFRKMHFFGIWRFCGYSFGTIFRGRSYAFKGLFLKSKYRMGVFFFVAKISNIFFGCLKYLIFFIGWLVDAGPQPTYAEKKIWVPPPADSLVGKSFASVTQAITRALPMSCLKIIPDTALVPWISSWLATYSKMCLFLYWPLGLSVQ